MTKIKAIVGIVERNLLGRTMENSEKKAHGK
jgi:hypothetical protein